MIAAAHALLALQAEAQAAMLLWSTGECDGRECVAKDENEEVEEGDTTEEEDWSNIGFKHEDGGEGDSIEEEDWSNIDLKNEDGEEGETTEEEDWRDYDFKRRRYRK